MTVQPERRLSAAHAARRRAPSATRKVGEALELVGLSDYADRPVVSAVGRPDAARGAGAQPRLRAAAAAARRAALQPRCQAAPAPARRPAPHHQADRRHRALRHARPGRGRGARRPHRRHARRQAAADGVRRRALQSPGRPVRRQLHRRLEPARRPRAAAQRRVRRSRGGLGGSSFRPGCRRACRPASRSRSRCGPRTCASAATARPSPTPSPRASPATRYQGTQTVYELDVLGGRIDALELGTSVRYPVGSDVKVVLPPDLCWAYPAGETTNSE